METVSHLIRSKLFHSVPFYLAGGTLIVARVVSEMERCGAKWNKAVPRFQSKDQEPSRCGFGLPWSASRARIAVPECESMNWRKAFDTVVNWWSGVAAVATAIAFLIPFLNAPTDQDPTGGAGPFAPIVALCVAAMILAEAAKGEGLQIRRLPSTFIGLGSMGSAYLWMAAEGDVHPLDPELPVALAILFAMAAVMLAVPLIAWRKSRPDDQASDD